MKPTINNTYYKTLKAIIESANFTTKEMELLDAKLNQAEIKNDIGVITLNSRFELEDTETGRIWNLTLTLPHQANMKKQKLSVLSSLGVALIGYKKDMLVEADNQKKYRILNVINE